MESMDIVTYRISQVYQLPSTIFLPLLTDRQIPVNRVSQTRSVRR